MFRMRKSQERSYRIVEKGLMFFEPMQVKVDTTL